MGRDLKFIVMTIAQYNERVAKHGIDMWHDETLEDMWSNYDKYRNLNFEYNGILTRDELKEKAHDAVDDDDFRTLEACAYILFYMPEDDYLCIFHNG
jgi:hypothetical protein